MSNTLTAGLKPGVWAIDQAHSEVAFTVRHMMVAKVRGSFEKFAGTLTIADDPLQSSVQATIDASSLSTRNEQRDAHLRSADYLESATYPELTFTSTSVRADGDGFVVTGDFSLHGVTRQIELALEFNGATVDPYGNDRAGFSASTTINRKDYGITTEVPMDGGGVVVGERITISLEIEAVRDNG
jgi:polyisoprenoid-binding protein YceI